MTEFQLLRQDLDISRAIMLTTIIVAITSIVFSSITMAFERSYNVKSLRPYFNLVRSLSTDSISLGIMNAGLGPMLITRIGLIEKEANDHKHVALLSEVLPAGLEINPVFIDIDELVLASKEEIRLFQLIQTDRQSAKNLAGLKETLANYSLYIEYKDVYEHKYQKTARVIL